MRQHGLEPDFPPAAVAEIGQLRSAGAAANLTVRDLRALLWCSIDNDDSRDLDQLSVAERRADGVVGIFVAIADVDNLVLRGSAIDRHAAANTTSVYTPAVIFPMLPEDLSTDLTSLGAGEDRLAVVVELAVAQDGSLGSADVYRARVQNHAKLAYDSVGGWLAGNGEMPAAVRSVPGLDDQLRMQDAAAQALSRARHQHGALDFEAPDINAEFDGDTLTGLTSEALNRARALIENLMIAANVATAKFLESRGLASIRRVVKAPERWDRLVRLAAETGDRLPPQPDSRALAEYLANRRRANPERYVDLSRTVIRLLGSGEYVVDPPGGQAPGHFGLAVRDYTHSTAPNRRYPDLVTQRLVKAALERRAAPYTIEELGQLAAHCTAQEDAANKVERQVRKSAAALLMWSRIGDRFDGIVTGASPKGTFVRVTAPPVEGMLVRGQQGLDVGDSVHVRLVRVDVERGFIDFEAVSAAAPH
jgi:exoribonuclease-2